MATAEEILATMADDTSEYEDVCLIDTDARTISIPEKLKVVGVESDEDVVRRTFRMPWQFGENDLSTFTIRINYLNAQGEGDIYPVEDMAKSGDDMTFSWLLSRHATKYKGNIRFVVCMILPDSNGIDKEWNTTLAEFTVLEGLETSGQIEEDNPDVIESILLRLSKLETSGGVTDEQIANAVNAYLKENPVESGATAEQAAQIQKNKEDIEELQKGGVGGAAIDDITSSTTTTYSSTKIDALINEQKEANAAQDERLSTLEQTAPSGTSGLTIAQVNALNGMFKVAAYIKADISAEYEAFKTAFGIEDSGEEPEEPDEPDTPEVMLTGISATYSGGNVTVGTALSALTGITVTATYSDGSTATVTGYTLSGEIVEGSNTITVSYGGMTTTFEVVGVAEQGGEGGETSDIPAEYQKIEYIQFDGNQRIVTENMGVDKFTYDVTAEFSQASSEETIVGLMSGSSSIVGVGHGTTPNRVFVYASGSTDIKDIANLYENKAYIQVEYEKSVGKTLRVNVAGKSYENTGTQTNGNDHSGLKFTLGSGGFDSQRLAYKGKIYGATYSPNGVLACDLVPCYRKSDSVIGMYDKVNNKFYTNAGTGSFGKGADVA